jgi:hypothetical protein
VNFIPSQKRIRVRTSLGILLLVAIVASSAQSIVPSTSNVSAPAKPHASEPKRTTSAEISNGSYPQLVINNLVQPEIRTEATHSQRIERQDESVAKISWDALVAFATVALACVTGWLVYYTRGLWAATVSLSRHAKAAAERQAGEMDRSLKLAEAANKISRDEFQYIHRPRLQIRRETIYFNPKDAGINLVLANIGHLPADKIVGNMNLKLLSITETGPLTKESLPPYGENSIDISGEKQTRTKVSVLEADERMFLYIPFEEISTESVALIYRNECVLFFFGRLAFVGPDGITRRSAFFRTYDPESHSFIESEDPDYEHH